MPLLLALLTLLAWTAPAHAIERLAVLELTGKSLSTDERAILTDTVRGAVVDSVGDSISVMTRENMEVMMTDMGLDATCVSEGACEVETARNLGVDYVISGSVASMSGTQVVSLKLLETRSGRMLGSKQVMGADALALMQGLAEPSRALVGPLAGAEATTAAAPPARAAVAQRSPAPSRPAEAGEDWTSPGVGTMKWIPAPTGPYWMMETEVTQAEWDAVMGNNPSSATSCGGDCPVDHVSWNDANRFVTKLSERDGVVYHLPTDAEWEYAAKGGESFKYAGSDDVDAVAWHAYDSGGRAHPACGKARNGYGLCDMSGNVWEWTASGDAGGSALHGGCFFGSRGDCRIAGVYNGPHGPDVTGEHIGFRIARSAP